MKRNRQPGSGKAPKASVQGICFLLVQEINKSFIRPHKVCVSRLKSVDQNILSRAEPVRHGHKIRPVRRFLDGHPPFQRCHHFKKANVAPKKTLREFRLDDVSAMNVGDILKADVFAAGDKVDVAGVSKGKGYQGVIKRFGQHRLRESHGTGPVARHAGSMGAISNPSRVFPGKRLPGHMGCVRVTVQNLTVVKVDTENNLIAVKGAVPGSKGTIITLANSVKA